MKDEVLKKLVDRWHEWKAATTQNWYTFAGRVRDMQKRALQGQTDIDPKTRAWATLSGWLELDVIHDESHGMLTGQSLSKRAQSDKVRKFVLALKRHRLLTSVLTCAHFRQTECEWRPSSGGMQTGTAEAVGLYNKKTFTYTGKHWVTLKLQEHMGGYASGLCPCFFFRGTKGGIESDFHRWKQYTLFSFFLISSHNLRIKAAAASHILPTQPWARFLSNSLHQSWHEQKTLSSNSLCDLWIHFCPFWMSKQYLLSNPHTNLNFLSGNVLFLGQEYTVAEGVFSRSCLLVPAVWSWQQREKISSNYE